MYLCALPSKRYEGLRNMDLGRSVSELDRFVNGETETQIGQGPTKVIHGG